MKKNVIFYTLILGSILLLLIWNSCNPLNNQEKNIKSSDVKELDKPEYAAGSGYGSIDPEQPDIIWTSALRTFTYACIANGAYRVKIEEVSDVQGINYQYTSTYYTTMKYFAGDFKSLKFYLKATDTEVLIDYDSMVYKYYNYNNSLTTYSGRKIYEAFYAIYTYFYGSPSGIPPVLAYMCSRNTRSVTDFANGDFLMKFYRYTRNEDDVIVANYYTIYKRAADTEYTIVTQWLNTLP